MAFPNGQSTNQDIDKQASNVQGAISSVEDSLKDFQGTMETAAKSTVAFVKRYPLQIFIGAAVIGAICGAFLIPKKNSEDFDV
jgi:hypothetical protein